MGTHASNRGRISLSLAGSFRNWVLAGVRLEVQAEEKVLLVEGGIVFDAKDGAVFSFQVA